MQTRALSWSTCTTPTEYACQIMRSDFGMPSVAKPPQCEACHHAGQDVRNVGRTSYGENYNGSDGVYCFLDSIQEERCVCWSKNGRMTVQAARGQKRCYGWSQETLVFSGDAERFGRYPKGNVLFKSQQGKRPSSTISPVSRRMRRRTGSLTLGADASEPGSRPLSKPGRTLSPRLC